MLLKISDALKAHRSNEKGSALIFAVLLTVVVMAIATTVTALGLINLQKTVFTARYTYYALAADTAVSHALLAANSPDGTNILRSSQGFSNAKYGSLDEAYNGNQEIKWLWYTERISTSSATTKYYVIATGYSISPDEAGARTLRVTLTSVANMNAIYTPSSGIVYYPKANAVSQWGMMGSSSVNLNTGVTIRSYISDQGYNPTVSTTQSQIASNGTITVNNAENAVNKLNFLNYSPAAPNRCTGTTCNTYAQQNIAYSTNLQQLATAVAEACPLQTYPVWKASENGGTLAPGCYNSVLFDTDTHISAAYTESNPALVYIKGDIIVEPGVTVNEARSPMALRIYSQGGSDAIFKQGSTSDPTKFYGFVAGSVLNCTDQTTAATSVGTSVPSLVFYGSMACDTINLGGGTLVWWDELSTEFAADTSNVRRLWYTEAYEELYQN